MDQELIRQAAEAIHSQFVERLKFELRHHIELRHEEHHEHGILGSFSRLSLIQQELFSKMASSALTIFYEHTRAQTREGRPLICPDCGEAMRPVPFNQEVVACSGCGRSGQ